ncbi:MAG: MATE family Na+-driven efflux transporter [Bacilli bacterium]|jgi:Na+-driven multidrug efflux pump
MDKIKNALKGLKSFDYPLFIALCALSLIPAIYQTIRTFLISTNTSTSGIDVIGQMEWFDLIDETIRAFLIVPLYSILNRILKNDKKDFSKQVFKTGIIVFVLYFLFSLMVFFYGLSLVKAMNTETVDANLVFSYLQKETIAFMIGIIPSFVNVVFVVIGKSKNVYIFMIVQIILEIIADFILIPNYGVNGVAYSNILTNSIMALVGIIVLLLEGYLRPGWFKKEDGLVAKSWLKIGVFSGGQQFVDNIVYALMIGKMVNMVAQQGNYWVSNNFIWGWLLIPVTALGEVIKHDCKDGYFSLKQSNYYLMVLLTVILWSVTIPLWEPFFQYAEQLENHKDIFQIVIKLFPFYIAYALTIIPDSIFIGMGKTIYSLICSLMVNLIYYGIFFACYTSGILKMSMNVIILMFGFGMVFHLLISLVEEKKFLKPQEYKLQKVESK